MIEPKLFARALVAASLSAIAVVACTPEKPASGGPQTPVGPSTGTTAALVPSATASAAPTAAPSAAPTGSATAGASASAPAGDALPPVAAGLPALDDTCAADADCTFTTIPASGKAVCCDNQCGATAVNKAYAKKLEAACGAFNTARASRKAQECPTVSCDEQKRPKPKCAAGHCALN
jgi:hypothetical protein